MQAPRGHARDLKPPTCPLPWHTASARQTRAAAGGGGGRGGRTLRETSVRTARRKVTRPETGSAGGTESAHRDRSAWGRGDPTSDVRRARRGDGRRAPRDRTRRRYPARRRRRCRPWPWPGRVDTAPAAPHPWRVCALQSCL